VQIPLAFLKRCRSQYGDTFWEGRSFIVADNKKNITAIHSVEIVSGAGKASRQTCEDQ
jgi:hypothetical protein